MKKFVVTIFLLIMISLISFNVLAEDKVVIKHMEPGDDAKLEYVHEFADSYMSKNPNVEIEIIEVGWGNIYQKMMSMAQSDEMPDVVYVGSRWIPVLAEMDAIQPLDSFMTEDKTNSYSESLLNTANYKENQYGLPRAYSTKTLFYRTDLIDNPPETWEELVEVAKEVQANNEGIYGMGISGKKHVSTTSQFFNYLFQAGGEVFDENGAPVINSEAGVKALQFYVDLYRKHELSPNPIEYNREELPTLFAEGKIAMFVSGPWAKSNIGREPDNEETPYQTASLPKEKDNKSILVSDSYVMAKDAGEEAWDYLNYITNYDNQTYYDYEYGSVPVMKKAVDSSKFQKDEFFKTFLDTIETGEPQPLPIVWETFEDIVTDAIQSALMGDMTPQEALDKAVEEIEEEEIA
ncbi:MAG: ABC transporter substrate-binding protein, partial [bacterium]